VAILRSGLKENFPYSLSRWTDVPISKWDWFKTALKDGKMLGISPESGVPSYWSLRPEDTLGLLFWTKDPTNLIKDYKLFENYLVKVHFTITGWHEVERNAPKLEKCLPILKELALTFSPSNVYWRFSPIPIVADVVERFKSIAEVAAEAKLGRVYVSFLQHNDLLPETRSSTERLDILSQMAEVASPLGVSVLLCNEDQTLGKLSNQNLGAGVCAPPEDFKLPGRGIPSSEGCGCALMVDPFTPNETCRLSCEYCYAADRSLSPQRRSTTKLPVIK